MKGKFITGILTLAVLLGLLLVPAMGVSVSAGEPGAGKATFLMPAEVKVLPGEAFAVDVTIYNPNTINIYSAGVDMLWSTPSMLGVSSIDGISWPTVLLTGWDNTTGEVYVSAGGSIANPYQNAASIAQCTVHFVAGTSEGTVTVSFTPGTLGETVIYDVGTNDICNWSAMQNLTVKIGTPKLTVDVSPAGKGDVKIAGVIPGSYPDVSNRGWDEVVSLEAMDSVAGWTFDSWSGDVGGSTNPTSVTMDALTKSVTANFVELPPVLDVDPLSLDFSARYGDNTDNKTVTISNTGGGTLCWAVGAPPAWAIGDNWQMLNSYEPFPLYNPLLPGSWNNTLVMAVTDDTDPDVYEAYADFLPWPVGPNVPGAQRTIKGGIPAVAWNATAWIDKCSLDYVEQLAVMTIWMPGPVPVYATVTWVYDSCHGWPYYMGKTWTYTVTQVVSLTPGGPPVMPPDVVPCMAMVTNVNQSAAGFSDCYEITHIEIATMTPFMQTWWSPTAKNFVQQVDGGTFDFPPPDIRVLLGYSVADPPPPPAWLSFDKVAGSLGIGGSEDLTVTASTSGLAVGTYTGSFDISACGSVQVETVDVSLEVLPATTIDVIRNLPADALDLDAEYPGDVFDVWVNFTAPIDDFNSIGLTDLAPAGWAVQTDVAWCSPAASWTKGEGNKAEYAWSGPYAKDQVFSAMYKVTIPATAKNGLNDWPNNDGSKAWAEYWFGPNGPYTSNVTGEWQKIVTVPGPVVGETRDVNADLLTTTLVVLSEEPAEALDEPEDSDSSTAPDALYEVWADDTGQYWLQASKYCYFTRNTSDMPITRNPWHADFIDFGTTAKLFAGYILDFEGDYGLVPKACTMSYAMKSVNHWLFTPTGHSEWQLSSWKAMESVHSWQFPAGCNT
jgi:hypothetical protein